MKKLLNFSLCPLIVMFLSCKKEDPVSSPTDDSVKKKPVVTVSSPIAGSVITGPVTFAVQTALADSIRSVEFFVDAEIIGRDTTLPDFSVVWYAGFWADGLQHELMVIAEDVAGDTVHSPPVLVTVSVDASVIGFAHPIPNQMIQAPLMIDLFVPPDLVLISAEFRLDGLLLGKDTTAPFEQYWNPAFWADGLTHTVTVEVVDSAGRTGKATPVTITVSKDALGYPVPLSPTNMLVVENLQQTFFWSAAPTAVNYEIEVSPLSGFTTDIEHTSMVADTSYQATLAERSIYFWRIRASNEFSKQTVWHEAEFASTPTFRIIRSYPGSERATSVDNTSDGGYVITGSWEYDGLKVIRTDKFGTEQWSRNFGMPFDYGYCIRQTTDGGYIVAARMESSTEGRFVVLKLNPAGGQTWLRRYGREWDEGALSVVETQEGGFVATGYRDELDGFYRRAWLVKTSASGDSLWARTYNRSAVTEGTKVLAVPGNGLIVLAAEFQLAGDTVASILPPDVWVLSTTADGDSLWSMRYGGTEDDYPADIALSGMGYVIVGHTSVSGMGLHDIVLRSIDHAGNEQWSRTFGTPARNDYARAVIAVTGGGYFVAGTTGENMDNSNDVFLIRTDMNGDSLWTKRFGSSLDDVVFSAREAADGGFIITGQHEQDIQIIKTDKRGRIAGVVY